MRSVIVVPTYNEVENIPQLFERIEKSSPESDVLVVDDGSPDGTADLAEDLARTRSGYRVYRRTGPRGLGCAYVDAFQRSMAEGYDRIVQMDADLSHDPVYLPAMLAAADKADLVIGSRYCAGGGVRDWPYRRVLLSRYANVYVHMVTGVPTSDATAGFRCWTRRALEAVDLPTVRSGGYSFQVEMVYRAYAAGVSIEEVPIVFTDRRCGQSKMSGKVIGESIAMPWRLRFGRDGREWRRSHHNHNGMR